MNEFGSLNALLVSRILRLREQSGLSIERLGELSMLDRGRLERILDGTEEISIDMVFLLAGALGVEPSTLLEGVEWIPDGKGGGQYRVPDLDD
jgi:transcriptional regulator with XRE-family HTH domain